MFFWTLLVTYLRKSSLQTEKSSSLEKLRVCLLLWWKGADRCQELRDRYCWDGISLPQLAFLSYLCCLHPSFSPFYALSQILCDCLTLPPIAVIEHSPHPTWRRKDLSYLTRYSPSWRKVRAEKQARTWRRELKKKLLWRFAHKLDVRGLLACFFIQPRIDHKKALPSLWASPREGFATPMGLRHWPLTWLAYVNSTQPQGTSLTLYRCAQTLTGTCRWQINTWKDAQ